MVNVNLIWLGSRILCVIISPGIVSMLLSWKPKPKYLDLQIQGLQPALREWPVHLGWKRLDRAPDQSGPLLAVQPLGSESPLSVCTQTPALPRPPERLQGPWEQGLQTPVLGALKGRSSVPGGEVRVCLFQTVSGLSSSEEGWRWVSYGRRFSSPAPKRKKMFSLSPTHTLESLFLFFLMDPSVIQLSVPFLFLSP